jgi:hypothetical protein
MRRPQRVGLEGQQVSGIEIQPIGAWQAPLRIRSASPGMLLRKFLRHRPAKDAHKGIMIREFSPLNAIV